MLRHTLLAFLALCLLGSLGAQAAGAPAAASGQPDAGTPGISAPAAPGTGGAPLIGSWKAERAIFELFGTLKDVAGQDERFYGQMRLDGNGKGVLHYGAKAEEVPIEYDLKNGQFLTVAYGSRLKPQVDLYTVLVLSDGSLFLRSTRLAQVNGTVFYIFRKAN